MEDFELELRIRNNRLKERRLGLRLTSREMANQIGVSFGIYSAYENLRQSPLGKAKFGLRPGVLEWRPTAVRIASFFGASPEEIWPDTILAVQRNSVTARIDADTLLLAGRELAPKALPAPDGPLEDADRAEVVAKTLAELTPLERGVVEARFVWERSLADIGRGLGLTAERVRQIEASAMRKLRRPRIRRTLETVR